MIQTEVEHFFQMTVRNNGGEDHKEKRFMCYNCESRLRHQSKCDVVGGKDDN